MKIWRNVERRILAFQFLNVALSFAEVGRATRRADVCEGSLRQMSEAYDAALLLSIRASFTAEDCNIFDSASSYVQLSLGALREKAWRLRSEAVDSGPDISERLKEWEPMWEFTEFGCLSEAAFAARAVRRHLRAIEDSVCGLPASLRERALPRQAITC